MTRRFGVVGGSAAAVAAVMVGAFFLVASPDSPAQTPSTLLPVANAIEIVGLQLVSETRVSRTISDLTYRVSIRNFGASLIAVSGSITSSSSAVTITDSTVSFGDVASNQVATSADTLVLRQDRSRGPFAENQLVWTFRAAPWSTINGVEVPPEPPASVNDSTLAGVDQNKNGVRDDVERIIAQTFGGKSDYPYAMAYAQAYQRQIIAPRPISREEGLILAGRQVCSAQGGSDALYCFKMRDVMENTALRVEAMRALRDVVGGYLGSELPPCAP